MTIFSPGVFLRTKKHPKKWLFKPVFDGRCAVLTAFFAVRTAMHRALAMALALARSKPY